MSSFSKMWWCSRKHSNTVRGGNSGYGNSGNFGQNGKILEIGAKIYFFLKKDRMLVWISLSGFRTFGTCSWGFPGSRSCSSAASASPSWSSFGPPAPISMFLNSFRRPSSSSALSISCLSSKSDSSGTLSTLSKHFQYKLKIIRSPLSFQSVEVPFFSSIIWQVRRSSSLLD